MRDAVDHLIIQRIGLIDAYPINDLVPEMGDDVEQVIDDLRVRAVLTADARNTRAASPVAAAHVDSARSPKMTGFGGIIRAPGRRFTPIPIFQ